MFSKKTLLTATAITGLAFSSIPLANAAPDPYARAEDSSIMITGVISEVNVENFLLDYGTGMITVEMDDWDFFDDAAPLSAGETVIVRGKIDNGFYEARTIEAASVYSYDDATYHYANDADEEGDYWTYSYPYPSVAPEGTWFGLSGIVKDVGVTEFTLDTGLRDIQVETAQLNYDPLDDQGYQQINSGDRVYVSGPLDRSLFDGTEIEAHSVVTLQQDAAKTIN